MSPVANYIDVFRRRVELSSDHPAFIFRDAAGGRLVMNWALLYRLAGRWANTLKNNSIGRGDIVVNTLPNSPERLVTDAGILLSGAASVNGQCQLRDGSDLLHVLHASRASAIILDPEGLRTVTRARDARDSGSNTMTDARDALETGSNTVAEARDTNDPGPTAMAETREARMLAVLKTHAQFDDDGNVKSSSDLPHLRKIFMIEKKHNAGICFLAQLESSEGSFEAKDVSPEDICVVFTTSGTTGFSKLVAYTHGTLASFFLATGPPMSSQRSNQLEFSMAPLGWVRGFLGRVIVSGCPRVMCDVWSRGPPEDIAEFTWRTVQEERCTKVAIVPSVLFPLVKLVKEKKEKEMKQTLLREKVAAGSEETRVKETSGQMEHMSLSENEKANKSEQKREKENQEERKRTQAAEKCEMIVRKRGTEEVKNDNQCTDEEEAGSSKSDLRNETPVQWNQAPIPMPMKSAWGWVPDSIGLGGQPITRSMIQAGRELANSVLSAYASSDFLPFSMIKVTDPDSFVDHDTGPPLLPGFEVKIVKEDDEETELTVGERGNILVKHPYMMKEYLNDPETTASAFTADEYFRTGDIGCLDQRGHLIVDGRGSDAIMRGAYIFYPGWLEARIRACPGVVDVVVVGIPDPVLHKELCACLVLESGQVTVKQVEEFVTRDITISEDDPLSPRPRYYLRFESFPLTSTGKPQRKIIEKQAMARLEPSAAPEVSGDVSRPLSGARVEGDQS